MKRLKGKHTMEGMLESAFREGACRVDLMCVSIGDGKEGRAEIFSAYGPGDPVLAKMYDLGDDYHFIAMLWFWTDYKAALVCPGERIPSAKQQEFFMGLFERYQRTYQFPLTIAQLTEAV